MPSSARAPAPPPAPCPLFASPPLPPLASSLNPEGHSPGATTPHRTAPGASERVPTGAACSLAPSSLQVSTCTSAALPATCASLLAAGQCPPSAPISAPSPPSPPSLLTAALLPAEPRSRTLPPRSLPALAAGLGWSVVPHTRKWRVRFPFRARTQVVVQCPVGAHAGGHHQCFSLPSSLSAFSRGPLSTYPGRQHFLTWLCRQSPAHPLAPEPPPRTEPGSPLLSQPQQSRAEPLLTGHNSHPLFPTSPRLDQG